MNGRGIGAGIAALVLFLVPAFAVPIYEACSGVWPGAGLGGPIAFRSLANGVISREVEADLEARSRVTQALRPRYNEFLFRAAGQTAAGVVRGADGWLFLEATVRDYPPADGDRSLPRTVETLARVVRWFESRGTSVLLLVVPNKASANESRLPAKLKFRSAYPRAFDEIVRAGIWSVDLLAVLRADGGEDAYLPRDTHWSWAGALRAVDAAAAAIRARVPEMPGRPVDGEIVSDPPAAIRGGLLRLLGLVEGGAYERSLYDVIAPIRGAERGRPRRSLGSTEFEPIVLAGTSFSHGYHLDSLLSARLGRQVESDALRADDGRPVRGTGTKYAILATMQQVLSGERDAPRLVVWEFPERYLFLQADAFRRPFDAVLDAAELHPRAARGWSLDGIRLAGATRLASDDARLEAIGDGVRPGFEVAPAAAGIPPGSSAFAFSLACDGEGPVRVLVDTGDGFLPVIESESIGFRVPQLFVVPLTGDADRPVRAVKVELPGGRGRFAIDPAAGTTTRREP